MAKPKKSRMEQILDEGEERLLASIEEALGAEKTYGVKCPRRCCDDTNGFQAPFPDIKIKWDYLKWILEYKHGKAAAKPQAPTKDPRENLTKIEEMSDEEIARLIGD